MDDRQNIKHGGITIQDSQIFYEDAQLQLLCKIPIWNLKIIWYAYQRNSGLNHV